MSAGPAWTFAPPGRSPSQVCRLQATQQRRHCGQEMSDGGSGDSHRIQHSSEATRVEGWDAAGAPEGVATGVAIGVPWIGPTQFP